MREYFFSLFLVLLLLSGCSKNEVIPPLLTSQDGQIILKIDRLNAPQNITTVTAYLTRTGFSNITGSMNLLSDTTADLLLNEIPVGIWHLKVDAADSMGIVKYSGETDVNVLENQTVQINLTLVPVQGGVGNIYLYVSWGTPTGVWIDYPGNPILYGMNVYEVTGAYQGKVLYEDSKYKMWYTGLNPGGSAVIQYAESNDGKNWTRPINNPVIAPSYNDWDQYSVGMGSIIKINGQYRLYYSGKSSQYNGWHIGLAYSQDGINWTKHPSPVVYASTGWESKLSVSDIVFKDDTYYLYYDGLVYNYPNPYIQYKTGVATSLDGINFIKSSQNPVLSPSQAWEGNNILAPSVIYEDGLFTMVYMNNSNVWALGKATSSDGINWIKNNDNPFFTAQNSYNNWTDWVGFPNYRKLNGEYRIYYSAEFSGPVVKMGLIVKSNQ